MTATCPACHADVLEALDPARATIRLNPRPSPAGKLAVTEHEDGPWTARLLVPARPLLAHETRYQPHTCAGRGGGLDEVRRQRSTAAHAARARRGRWQPAGRSPFARASGVRITPPGDSP